MQVNALAAGVERWLADIASTHASPATVRSYRVSAQSFLLFTRGAEHDQLVDAPLVLRYVQSMRRLSPRTQHSYAGAVLRFLEYLVGEGIEPGIPAEDGRLLAVEGLRLRVRAKLPPPPLPEAPEIPDLRRLITFYDRQPSNEHCSEPDERDVLNQLRNSALLHTLFSTAGRIAEVLGLDLRQIRRRDGSIAHTVEVAGKGRKQRPLHLRDHARRRISLYLARRQTTFPKATALFISHGPRNAGGRLSAVTGWRIVTTAAGAFSDILRGEGAEEAVAAAVEQVTPHSLRHFVALYLLNEGVELSEVAALLGHSSTTVTEQVYATHRRSQLAELHDTFAPEPLAIDGLPD
jgi:site-specific recombinase XerD